MAEKTGGKKMTSRYMAKIRIGDKEFIVFPRTRKRQTFRSVEAAYKALERYGRKLNTNAQGRVVSVPSGELVGTMAI